jgi:hypothetical protein
VEFADSSENSGIPEMVSAQQYPPKRSTSQCSTISSPPRVAQQYRTLNNIRAKRSTISNALNSYATQQYLAAQQYPPPKRSTISGQKSAQHNIQLESAQQYPTTLNSTALNNI